MKKNIEKLILSMKGANKIYIQPHNMPDPDAIAGSFGLQELLKLYNIQTEIIYVNVIEKFNSKNMLEMFNINMSLKGKNFIINPDDYIILIDSQIGNSNLTNIKGEKLAVIDHHNDSGTDGYLYRDIRPNIGACSTIISDYYRTLNITPSQNVATALLYGIINDTNNLIRTDNIIDLENFYWLYKISNIAKIKSLRMNEIGREDIDAYAKALETIEIYGHIGFIHIENCNDSLLGTISDMVYTIEGVSIVVSYARRDDGIKFSIRSGEEKIHADKLIKYIVDDKGVGGGHKEMAGGFITDKELIFLGNKSLDTYVRYRAISFVEQNLIRSINKCD